MADISGIEEALYELEEDYYLTVTEAMKLTGMTRPTIIRWCKKYGCGRKIGGLFKVDPKQLTLLLKGQLKNQIKGKH